MELGAEGMLAESDMDALQVAEDVAHPDDNPTPNEIQLPRFSHLPPATITGCDRWPASLEAQAFPPDATPTLYDVMIWTVPYLETDDIKRLKRVGKPYQHGPGFGPLWFTRPWSPNRRRRWGFGIPSSDRTVVNDKPPVHLAIHFVWTFLSPHDRVKMTKLSAPWFLYQKLRAKAISAPISQLLQSRPSPQKPKKLSMDRAILYACALLRFHFYYGDFVRWLGGEYTNRHRDWDETFDTIQAMRERKPPATDPVADLPRGKRIFTQGVPLKGDFQCPVDEIPIRDKYDNHPAIKKNYAAVEEKFAKEEQKSFHIHFPRFLIYFIVGLLLNPLQWEFDKGKGRICVDCTNGADGPDNEGSANTHIPKPSPKNPDECPPVFYASALMRFFILIWRLRITFPETDILLHADDLDSAFRRILYSPEMAILFAYIFGQYLIIPVGQVFGSRSAPSFFSLTSDIRADLATTGSLVENFDLHPQARDIEIPSPPDPTELSPAIADEQNPPLNAEEQQNYHNATFVDDNGVCAVRDRIVSALHQSLVAAFILFGWPWQDRRSSCMAEDKWANTASYVVLFLGFYINSRSMTVTWPLYKRQALYDDIQVALASPRKVTPRMTASIIGKVRSAGEIAPWGPYISFSVADTLKNATRQSFSPVRSWWSRGKVRFSKNVQADLRFLSEQLVLPEFSPVWSCYIGLLVPRTATHSLISDASYEGLGGWSPRFEVQWRLTKEDLLELGFHIKIVEALTGEPTPDQVGLHINPLEFIATIINLWLLLILVKSLPACATGYIVDILSDNTSALSWLKLTATTKDSRLQPLARFASALLIQARRQLVRVQPCHIKGDLNIEADALSRFQNGRLRSFADVIKRCSRLATCRICLLPRRLLLTIADLCSSRPIEGTFDEITTNLLTHELDFLPSGSNLSVIRSSLPSL
jgi:hypothetical protein